MSQEADFDIYDFYTQLDLEAAFRNSWRDEWNREQAAWDEWKQSKDAHTVQWLNRFDYKLTFNIRFEIEHGLRRSWQEWRSCTEWITWIAQEREKEQEKQRQKQAKADWKLVTGAMHRWQMEEWSFVNARESAAWDRWFESFFPEDCIANLRAFFGNGSNGKHARFTSEGGIAKPNLPRWTRTLNREWGQRWRQHVESFRDEEIAYTAKVWQCYEEAAWQCMRERVHREREAEDEEKHKLTGQIQRIQSEDEKAWRALCAKKQEEYEAGILKSEQSARRFMLAYMKKLSGFTGRRDNASTSSSIVSAGEWAGCYSGKPGWRSCGPASWDNCVRALEDG